MGKYLDALESWDPQPYNFTGQIKNDSITEAINISRETTNDKLGPGLIFFIWTIIYVHIAKTENQFNLTAVQAMISTNAIVFSFALMFLYLEIMASIQVFIWVVLLMFGVQVWGIMRSTN